VSNLLDIKKRIVQKKENEKNGKSMEIRDAREHEWFYVDNVFIDKFARKIGIYAVSVYLSLCRHANKEQTTWPSIHLISDEIGITGRSTSKGLKSLEDHCLIRVDRVTGQSNIYTLLNKRKWKINGSRWYGVGGSHPATKKEIKGMKYES
jgi:hypothetical protein